MILFIHRKDLRIDDLTAFDYIHQQQMDSVHLLILDPFLLKHNRHLAHSGVNFLRHVRRLMELYQTYRKKLIIAYGEPTEVVAHLLTQYRFTEIVVHQDYTPYALNRDCKLKKIAEDFTIPFTRLMDQALIHFSDFQSFTGKSDPYRIYTPFYRKWQTYLDQFVPLRSSIHLKDLAVVNLEHTLAEDFSIPFQLLEYAPAENPESIMVDFLTNHVTNYMHTRDNYAHEGTSTLSKHINVGAISIRHIYLSARQYHASELWIRQLAWRDFYLYQSVFDTNFYQYEKKYDLSSLSDQHFEAWKNAKTGIPIIDAAMTQLKETGQMPNRLRMVTAMFLTKNLLCPFPLGEQTFRYLLQDYDNTLNRGGWLWSSSLGFDAAPYFRIMNPVTQSETHDPTGTYIREWLPELKHMSDKAIHQPLPYAIVDLKESRAKAIEKYKSILS